jgi:integrase
MTVLCANLDTLQPAEVKAATQIAIDTGRRPEDILGLPLDCLARDKDGAPVLVYDNAKAHRLGRRLPVSEATATVITGQQARVRARFPGTPPGELKLLPAARRNPDGRRPMTIDMLEGRHREWAGRLGPLRTRDGAGFNTAKIVPYAYRHTYVISPAFSVRGTAKSGACRIVPHKYSVLREARATTPVPGSFSLRCRF